MEDFVYIKAMNIIAALVGVLMDLTNELENSLSFNSECNDPKFTDFEDIRDITGDNIVDLGEILKNAKREERHGQVSESTIEDILELGISLEYWLDELANAFTFVKTFKTIDEEIFVDNIRKGGDELRALRYELGDLFPEAEVAVADI